MSIFKSLFDKSDDDRLFEEFLKANEQMNGEQAEKCVEQMSDEGLLKATFKIDTLAKSDPGYLTVNVFLLAAFAKRPHLSNPFLS